MTQPRTDEEDIRPLSGRFVYSRPGELRLVRVGDPDAEPIDFSPLPAAEADAD
ncbi:hypothetical protein GVN21_16865 [Caulobacter sp. SLTY]|uniref:hypothetical protein n=1 Tax=Caulobacter sp. SLTY TaxID=2683262 RepID=UPI001412785F|nr:hypothetical protein [Caulobacter sp. SLTY]NBB17040.1 hypothetical protein [Caulobacter sp. SLTY]